MAEATSASQPTIHPTATSSSALSSITPPNTAGIDALANATQLVRPSSPRKRDRTPDAASAVSGAAEGALHSPLSPKSFLPGTAPPLTAAAEMVEQAKRRKLANAKDTPVPTSENPAAKAAAALSGEQAVSRPEDAPDASKAGAEPMAGVEASRTLSAPKNRENLPIDPAVTADRVSGEHRASLAESRVEVASPGQMAEDDGQNHTGRDDDHLQVNDPRSGKALTYPGPASAAQAELDRRNMSVDSGMPREEPKSTGSVSSSKKHKCPYCATEFTRHHNLKSHLLTHSHEKPYLCQDCDSRFRRLHDLKRHMKLHTGERPHVCPICQRSFARGDALARHNKGQGGCALRRYSAGSFGGDGDESMEGMIYTTGDASQEPENMDRDNDGPSPRTSNVPSIRHHDAPDQPVRGDSQYQRQPSTYPPVASRAPNAPMGSSLYPPGAGHGGANGPQSPSGQSSSHGTSYPPPGYSGGSGYPPMTESPKPLSPSQHPGDTRNRSPSISQLSANQFARQPTSRELPPPPNHSSAPTLPPPPGMTLGPHDSRYGPSAPGSASYPPPPQSGTFPGPGAPGGGPSSASNSLSSHGTGPAGSGERSALPYSNDERLWAIIRSLEAKVERLEGEVGSLRQQLQHQQSYPPPGR